MCLAPHVRRAVAAALLLFSLPLLSGQSVAVDVTAPLIHVNVDTTETLPPPAPLLPAGVFLAVGDDSSWDPDTISVPATVAPTPARLSNLSVRATMAGRGQALIVGASITGDGSLPVLVRAIGPGLKPFHVPGALASAPTLSVFRGSTTLIATNTLHPLSQSVATRIGTFTVTPSTNGVANGDAALVGTPGPGVLTAHVTADQSGTVLTELYDAPGAETQARFANLSARGTINAGDGVMILGFSVAGPGTVNLLLRGVGASLSAFDVPDALPNPQIELYSGNTRIATNDDWNAGGAAAASALSEATAAAGAFTLTSSRDAALVATLPAGSYTLHIRPSGVTSSGVSSVPTGAVLGEVYLLPASSGTFNAARSINGIGLDLYRSLAPSTVGNTALSPYSIQTALALAYAGARGETRRDMARVLGFPESDGGLQSGLKAIADRLARVAADSVALAQRRSVGGATTDPISWSLANRAFGQQGFPFRAEFLQQLAGYEAPLASLDFIGAAEPARTVINDWVAGVTRNRIQDLIPSGGVTEDTRFVLVNALYLKAPWEKAFSPEATKPEPFHLAPNQSVNVPTMRDTGPFGYASDPRSEVVALPYLGGGLQLLVLLPKPGETIATVAADLTPQHFERWRDLPAPAGGVALQLPRFTIEIEPLALAPAFVALGMGRAFDRPAGTADFSGIADPIHGPLMLQDVFHKTFVAVDEKGTEAAAATAVTGGTTSLPPELPAPVPVHVDRPFLFAIQDRETGTCLFLGRVVDPR